MNWLPGRGLSGRGSVRCGVLLVAVSCSVLTAQRAQVSPKEQEELEAALAEAGPGPIEYLRAIEKHLQRYPNSPRKEELERAATRAAIEANDDARIITWGERVLARQGDDLQLLDRVSKALLSTESAENASRALKDALRYEEVLRAIEKKRTAPANEIDGRLARAHIYQARATSILGRNEEALGIAQRAFEESPTAEAAREIARCFERLGKPEEAARALADAFTIPDGAASDADRARDRARMGDLYRQAKGSEAGLGDVVLEAYDRNVALLHLRELRMRSVDPNANLTDPMEFTLGGLDRQFLNLSTLRGKVVVLEFWATWCVPCRVQHPMYEEVRKRFASNADVLFLSINTDEDRSKVKPFLESSKWPDAVYFEDGLSRALRITTIPTTIVMDRRGKLFSRLNGFVPGRFVLMLTERIQDSLKSGTP